MKLSEIAAQLACQVAGDPELQVAGLATLEEAGESDLSFLSNPKYKRLLKETRAAAVILADPDLLPPGKSGLVSPNPYLTFAEALQLFFPPTPLPRGIHPQAYVSPEAVLGVEVSVGAFAVIEAGATLGDRVTVGPHCVIYPGASVGDDSRLYAHCVVREGCRLGRRVILQDGVTIGSDGFGYAQRDDRSWQKIPQTGVVIIEDDVEVGAGSCIDRSTLGQTLIRRGVKIDNLVQVGHGCIVGEDTLLCAQAGLAGSTRLGRQVILGGQVGAAGHLTIGDRVVATAQTGIPGSVEPGRVVSGYPAMDNRQWLKASAVFNQLPELAAEFRRLKQQVAQLAARLDQADVRLDQ